MRLSWFKKQLTKLMHINQTPEDVPKSTIKVESGESPILVFVSSIQTDELQEARDITTRTIRSFLVPEATVWAFEYTPAASEKPDKNYLRKVRQCDIFIWLVGRTTSIPVRNEIHEAIAANRHKLVFALFEERDTETEELLKKVGESAKYQETSLKELSRQILLAIGDMFTRAVRDKPDIGLEAMLDEMERRSKGRCISSWQSIGIPSDVATKLSEDSRVGEPTVEMFPSVEQPVILISGNLGSGKSLHAEKIYQTWITEFRKNIDSPIPVFLKAHAAAGSLEEEVIRNSSSLGNPRLQGVRVVTDGADEAGLANASLLIDEARVLSRTWPNSMFVITSRPISHAAKEELVQVPDLDEIAQFSLIELAAGKSITTGKLSSWPQLVRDAIKLPLFALLLGKYLSENDMRSPRSTGELIANLMEQSAGNRGIGNHDIRKDLQKLARLSTERAGGPVPESEVGTDITIQDIINTRLVIRENRCLSFQLPLFRQWYAANEFLDDNTLSTRLVGDSQQLERWRYSYVIATAIFDNDVVSGILEPVVIANPGFASEIISEGIASWGTAVDVYPPPALECGNRVRNTMKCWLKGIDPLSMLIGPIDDNGDLVPIGVKTSKVWLSTGWYFGPDQLNDVVDLGSLQSILEPFPINWKFIRSARPGRQSAWAWKWSHDQLVSELSNCLRSRGIPVVGGTMAREMIWLLMLKATGKGQLCDDAIPVGELKRIFAILPEDDSLGLHKHLSETMDSVQREGKDLMPPWPRPDRHPEGKNSFRVWELYSDPQLLSRTKAILGGALEIYEKITTTWFGWLSARMNTAVTLPAQLIGKVKCPDVSQGWNGSPGISWYLHPLPMGAENSVELLVTDDVDSWEDLRPEQRRLQELRPEASEWVSIFNQHQILDFVFGPNPATELAYHWIWDDLKRMSWVDGLFNRK